MPDSASLRLALAASRAPLVLAGLGAISGVLAGLTIVALRGMIDWLSSGFMPGAGSEHFEGLSLGMRVALPLGGAILLGGLFSLLAPQRRRVGLMHVLDRLHFHDGQLPASNILVQFCGAVVAILSGHSVGRESPSIHLGAGVASQLAGGLSLPHNSTRVLNACGTAAGIAASFNTPLAGVVFAMEVVLMEYTVAGFAPVILAAVAATAVTRTVFDASVEFDLPRFELMAVWELAMMTLLGLLIGVLSVVFSGLIRLTQRTLAGWPVMARFTLAGFVCAAFATVLPEVLGLGYDTVNHTIQEGSPVALLLALVCAKIIATSFCVGAGIPGGLIGPALIVGGLAGALWTESFGVLFATQSHPGLYVLMGMGAMLQAPMAGLLALLELTGNPNLIMPGMLATIAANLTYKEVLGRDSVVYQIMGDQGLRPDATPMARTPRWVRVKTVRTLLERAPNWFSVTEGDEVFVVSAEDLRGHIDGLEPDDALDLAGIPLRRLRVVDVRMQATCLVAHAELARSGAEAVRVTHRPRRHPDALQVLGILTPRDLEALIRVQPEGPLARGPD